MDTIGFIGLGIMGRPMTKNLLSAGYPMRLYARRPESLEGFEQSDQVTVCQSPQDVASQADYTITMVSDTPDVEAVICGDRGVMSGAKADSIVIDMSTIAAAATRDIAKQLATKGVHMLDAPVSGGEQGAIAGTLSIMVGGERATFERAKPILGVLGQQITYVGDHGAGQIAKACNQLHVAQTIAATAEVIELAVASGVDPRRVREALLGGFAYSKVLEIHGQRILDEDFAPGFKARLHLKDLRIADDTAREAGLDLKGLKRTLQDLHELVEQGQGELDSSALAQIVRKHCK